MAVRQPDFIIKGGQSSSGGGGSAKPIEEVPSGARNGVNRTFKLTHTPAAGYPILLFLNGIYQNRFIVEYTDSGPTITYAVPPTSTDTHAIVYWIGPGAVGPLTARSFAGGTDKVNVGNSSVYLLLADMSAGIWFKLPSNAQGSLITRGNNDATTEAQNTVFELNVTPSGPPWNLTYEHDHGASVGESHSFATAIPADAWGYGHFSRDSVAKTVSLFLGDGVNISLVQTWTYTTNPTGGTDPACLLQLGNLAGGSGGVGDGPLIGVLQQSYIWNRTTTIDEAKAAMLGSPPTSGLIWGCTMGNTPELDFSPTGASGAVTGTTLVQGH